MTMRIWLPSTRYGRARAHLERLRVDLRASRRASLRRVRERRARRPHGRDVRELRQSSSKGRRRLREKSTRSGSSPSPRDTSARWASRCCVVGTFDSRDGADTTRVAIVSATAASRFWPGEDPIGRRFTQDGEEWFEVVGNRRRRAPQRARPGAPRGGLCCLFQQAPFPFMTLVVRSPRGEPEANHPDGARGGARRRPEPPVVQDRTARGGRVGVGLGASLLTRSC